MPACPRPLRCVALASAVRIGAGILASLALAGGWARLVAEEPSGAWRMTPLVTSATPISDLAGKHVVEFGEVFLRPAGELAFWGRLADRDEWGWSLLSYREGVLKAILEGGKDVACKHSTDPAARFLVRMRSTLFHGGLPLANGRLLYLGSTGPGVYAWDGERVRPILRAGDHIDVAGRAYTLSEARLLAAGVEGDALIYYVANQPSKLRSWALADGESVWPLAPEAVQLPGAQLGLSSTERAVLPGHMALTTVSGRGVRAGLYALGPSQARPLVEAGAAFPFALGRTIRYVTFLFAQSATRFVTMLTANDGSARYALHDGEKVWDLTPPEALASKRWSFRLWQGDFLSTESPWFLFKGDAEIGGFGLKYAQGTQVYLFDGKAVRRLTDSHVVGAVDRTRIERILGGDWPGALVRANLSGLGPKGKLPDEWPLSFLDLRDLAAGLKPVPQLELEGGRRVSLEAVVATPAPGVALAVLADGIYRLEKSGAVAP